jgi:hypothetical protein
MGSVVLGKGFLISPKEAERLIIKDPRNKEVLFPYLTGDDLNNHPEHLASRWVINFFDWSLEKAQTYPDCFEIVEQLVKPERQRPGNSMGREKWWQFYRRGIELYNTISKLDQVMAINRHSKHLLISISKKRQVYSDATIVFALESYHDFAILSSSLHEIWAWKNSSTMGVSTLRYSTVNAFETFPFPSKSSVSLEDLGRSLNLSRSQWMAKHQKGLTELQNTYHSKNHDDKQIENLRSLCRDIDLKVLESYGWTDINLEHNFYEVEYLPENDRLRYTVHPHSRKEIFKRLLLLNQKLYQETKTQEPIPKKQKKSTKETQATDLFLKE